MESAHDDVAPASSPRPSASEPAGEHRLTDEQADRLQDRAARAEAALWDGHEAVRADPDRPAFHLAPPVGRLNDPNGLVRLGSTWHAFYQYSPLHPEKGVFWRHATSPDLLTWTDEGTALSPVHWFDKNGCYSGSGVVTDSGALEFFWTGNVKDPEGNREAYQCLAVSDDGGATFSLPAENPLISGPAPGYTAHFRDPDVTRAEDGTGWRMLLGAQREDLTGAIVRYDSPDRRTWTFAGELRFDRPETNRLGYMDECPGLVRLTDERTGEARDLLLFCPQGMAPDGDRFVNRDQSGYVLGRVEGTEVRDSTPFREFDAGFEFYAPQVFAGAGERAVMLGWMGNPAQDDQPSWEHGWVHLLTLPRELALVEGEVVQRPVPEVDRLLPLAAVDRPRLEAADGAHEVPALAGSRHHRLALTARPGDGEVEISWHDAEGRAVSLRVSADRATVDRSASRYTDGGHPEGGAVRTRALPAAGSHEVEAFFDGSALEIFLDGGACVFTLRAYLGEATGVRIQCVPGESSDGSAASRAESVRAAVLAPRAD